MAAGASCRSRAGCLEVTTSPERWSDAVLIDVLKFVGFGLMANRRRHRVFLKVKLIRGSFGISITSSGLDGEILLEQVIDARSPELSIDLGWLGGQDKVRFRNHSAGGESIFQISEGLLVPGESPKHRASLDRSPADALPTLNGFEQTATPYSLRDKALQPFIHKFVPRFAYESEFNLYVSSTHAIKNAYFTYKRAPLAIFSAIQSVMKLHQPTYWDIGANLGISTLQLARIMASEGGFTLALECEPENLASLSHNLRENQIEGAAALLLAAGNKNQLKWLNINSPISQSAKEDLSVVEDLGALSGRGLHTLKSTEAPEVGVWGNYNGDGMWVLEVRLDLLVSEFAMAPPDYLFIDAALYENEVLEGFLPIVEGAKKPLAIMVEQTPGGAASNATSTLAETFIWEALNSHGYCAFQVEQFSVESFHSDHSGSYFMTIFIDKQRLSQKLEDTVVEKILELSSE